MSSAIQEELIALLKKAIQKDRYDRFIKQLNDKDNGLNNCLNICIKESNLKENPIANMSYDEKINVCKKLLFIILVNCKIFGSNNFYDNELANHVIKTTIFPEKI